MIIGKLQEYHRHFAYLPRALRMTWEAARVWTIVWMVLLLVQGLLPVASVYLTKTLIDQFIATAQGGVSWPDVQPLLGVAALMGTVMVTEQVLQHVLGLVRTAQSEHFSDYIYERIHTQAVAVDIAYYETSDYYDRMHRVLGSASTQPLALLETMGALAQNTITLVAMGAMLTSYAWWLPVVLFVSAVPAFRVLVRFNTKYHAWWEKRTEQMRRAQYFSMVLTAGPFAPEVRLFGLGDLFKSSYSSIRSRLRGERLALEKQQVFARVGAALIALAVTAGTIAWIGWRVLTGGATFGDAGLFYRAFEQGQQLMRALFSSASQVQRSALFLHNLFDFLDQKPNTVSPPAPLSVPRRLTQGIRFENVTFRYPGSEHPVLRNFNLTIPAGKTVAIVGENGAGKTTLVKLLARFYDPTEGAVTVDGVDLRRFSVEELRRRVSVLFQFPVNYQATAAESIALGDVTTRLDQERVESAARAAGIEHKILTLPAGYDTFLGKWFTEGHELSGGEWQRLAMARAFYRDAPIFVLDEPTSMMDSWAEADWFDRFRALADGRTGVIITHRFTIAKRADIIHVMQNGTVVESGTHEELLAAGGLYMRSWVAQVESEQAIEEDVQLP